MASFGERGRVPGLVCVSRLAAELLLAAVAGTGCAPAADRLEYSITPDRRTISPGQSASYGIVVSKKANINSRVSFRTEGVPSGATVTFSPPVLPDTGTEATMTIATTTDVAVGSYPLDVFGQEIGNSNETPTSVSLLVTRGEADFLLTVDPVEDSFTESGQIKTFTFQVSPIEGFTGTVSIGIGDLSDDLVLTAGPTPASVSLASTGGAGGSFLLGLEPVPPITTTTSVVVTAQSGGLSHSRTIALTLPEGALPTGSIELGWTLNGETPTAILCPPDSRVQALIDGVLSQDSRACLFGDLSVQHVAKGHHTVEVQLVSSEPEAVVASATVPGGVDVGSASGAPIVDLVFTPPDFALSVSPDVTVPRGMSRSTTVTVTPTGFDQTVDLRTSTLPAGVTASFEPVTVVGAGTSTL
ncbi:MAG TPA: hypothetical protein VGF31_04500, partial [Myxococcaceae bacterium]